MDLFGEPESIPSNAGKSMLPCKVDSTGFVEFWSAWPGGPRKVAKQQCLAKWVRYQCSDEWELIVQHVEWMKEQNDWRKDQGAFIPQPMTYLNQRRWDGWEPLKKAQSAPSVLEAIKAHKGAPIPAEIRQKIAGMLPKRALNERSA